MSKLNYFMKEELKKDEIVEIPGVETFKDEDGNIIPFKIKILDKNKISEIRKAYTTRKMIVDSKKKPLLVNGEVQYSKEYDGDRATDHIIVDSFIDPKLDDPKLMAFYGVVDRVDMPGVIFRNMADYQHVSDAVISALGFSPDEVEDAEDSDDKMEIEEVKNS